MKDLPKFIMAGVLAVVVLLVSIGAGGIFYYAGKSSEIRGYKVEVVSAEAVANAKPLTTAELLAAADPVRGKKLAKKCLACHTLEKGQPAKVGPNLYDVVNGNIAHMAGFAYSDGMLEKAKSGATWTYDNLLAFLASPKAFVPGTKMTFAGFNKPKDRADMVAYLRSLSDNPAALPAVK
jgi:cytochrome c